MTLSILRGWLIAGLALAPFLGPDVCSQPVPIDSMEGGVAQQNDRVVSFSVRDQPVDQVLLAFAERSGLSIVTDATVSGSVSLVLHNRSSREVLEEIAAAGELFVTERNGVFWLSRIYLEHDERDRWELHARRASFAAIIQRIASRCGVTILGAPESERVYTLSTFGTSPTDLIDNLSEKVGYTRVDRGNGHLLLPSDEGGNDISFVSASPVADGELSPVEITRGEGGDYVVAVRSETAVITVLEAIAGALEMTLLTGGGIVGRCPPFEIEETTWERLSAQLETVFGVTLARDGDLLFAQPRSGDERFAPFRRRAIFNTGHLSSPEIREIVASNPDLEVEWIDASGGRVVVSGFAGAIRAMGDLIALVLDLERPPERVSYRCLSSDAATVARTVEALFPELEVRTDIATNTVSAEIPPSIYADVVALVRTIDSEDRQLVYRCRYALPETAIAAVIERFSAFRGQSGADAHTIILDGPRFLHDEVQSFLAEIDRPTEQIRFDLCILQYQYGDARQHGITASIDRDDSAAWFFGDPLTVAAAYDRMTSVQFDFLSTLGYRAALSVSEELTNNTARLVVDTSLRAAEGEAVHLENASTYRYRDVLGDDESEGYRAVTREIDSGLTVDLTGIHHGDRTISVEISVGLSKNGTDMSGNGNPPPTSRKQIETKVTITSGEAVVIGGLLQREESLAEHRFPLLGRIPLLRYLVNGSTRHIEETEFVLYLTAFPVPTGPESIRAGDQLAVLQRIAKEE